MTEVSMAVNGTHVTLDVEPRLTLGDALRQRLGLTGTHFGCEHGVCGACTVLVDGAAVRSCLMFAVQADGAEVTTVEALGTPDDLHPLQEALRRHHGLQCGFCTPGFLMSSYELLRDGSDVDKSHLAEELAGVLCRCTGYRGIVAAVGEIAEQYPGGVPEPHNLGAPLTPLHGPPTGEGEGAPEAPAEALDVDAAQFDLVPPSGEPNETVAVSTHIEQSPDEAWTLLSDLPRAARCMPGVELAERLADDTYRGRAQLAAGPLRFRLAGAARVLERDEARRTIRALAVGEERGGAGVRALLEFGAAPGPGGGAEVSAQARLYLSGRVAQFGRSLAGDVSRQLFEDFGRCVERTLAGEEPAEPRRLGALALAARTLRSRLGQALRSAARRLGRRAARGRKKQ